MGIQNGKPVTLFSLLVHAVAWVVVNSSSLLLGDIATINFWVDESSNGCAFVSLVNIPAAESVMLTTYSWDGVASAFDTSIGSTLVWTAPDIGLEAGTVVSLETFRNATAIKVSSNASIGSVASGLLQFQAEGDQILSYQGTSDTPSFLFALNFAGSGWNTADDVELYSSFEPPEIGNASLVLLPFDSYAYEGPTSGSRESLLLDITNSSNWVSYNGNEGPRFTARGVFDIEDVVTRLPPASCNFVCMIYNAALFIFDFFAN